MYRQISNSQRDFTDEQIEFLTNIVRLYRGKEVETDAGSREILKVKFPDGRYADVAGLCKVATVAEIEAQGWSLNPGRYIGIAERDADGVNFLDRLEELNEELESLNVQSKELEHSVSDSVGKILQQS